jgi:hypothetical protein
MDMVQAVKTGDVLQSPKAFRLNVIQIIKTIVTWKIVQQIWVIS